ncbi:MAG: hypothetical protein ACLFS3_03340 [Candidatus Aenigmatarchaeota archaeon]
MSYKNLSKNEALLLNEIDGSDLTVFSFQEIRTLTDWNTAKVNNLLQSLLKKNIVEKIKRDSYVLVEDIKERSYKVATELIKPSYISHWSALSYYGFTDQQVNTIQLITTKQMRDIDHKSIRIETTTFKSDRFYGYKKNGFSIGEKEKVILDSLYMMDRVGGFEEFVKCMVNAWDELHEERFVNYLLNFGNKSMVSRAGYLIDKLDLPFDRFAELQGGISKSYVKLVPGRGKENRYNKEWKVIVNGEVPNP